MSSPRSVTSPREEPKESPSLDKEDEYADAEKNFKPKSLKFWTIIIGMYMSILIVALDRMIIATAIPSITNDFHSIQDIGWYGNAYMLTAAVFNPLSGRIYQLYSTEWVFLSSIIVFEAGSALCGAAPTSAAFIVGRAIAGIGASGIFTGGMMIILPLVPLRRRPVFTSFFGIAFGISSVLGPLVGGSFTDNSHLTWRWCFYINLPIGGFTFIAILLFLHLEQPPREQLSLLDHFKRLDPLGVFFLAPSMVCLILALQWGGSTYPWSAPKIIGLLVTFASTFLLFLVVETTKPKTAMAPTRVVLNRTVGGSMLFMLLSSGGLMAIVHYLTIWFQAAQGQSAMEAGIRTPPLLLSMTVFGIVAAVFTEKVGYYVPAMLLSPILCATGAGLLSTLTPNAGINHWIGYQVIYGFGTGAGFQTATLGPQTVLPRADVPLGMALMFFMQQLGGSVFISVGQNILSSQLVDSLSGLPGLDNETIINTGATALHRIVPSNILGTVVGAYSHVLTGVFVLAAALSACMILGALAVEWKNITKEKNGAKDAETGPKEARSEDKNDGILGEARKEEKAKK